MLKISLCGIKSWIPPNHKSTHILSPLLSLFPVNYFSKRASLEHFLCLSLSSLPQNIKRNLNISLQVILGFMNDPSKIFMACNVRLSALDVSKILVGARLPLLTDLYKCAVFGGGI